MKEEMLKTGDILRLKITINSIANKKYRNKHGLSNYYYCNETHLINGGFDCKGCMFYVEPIGDDAEDCSEVHFLR